MEKTDFTKRYVLAGGLIIKAFLPQEMLPAVKVLVPLGQTLDRRKARSLRFNWVKLWIGARYDLYISL